MPLSQSETIVLAPQDDLLFDLSSDMGPLKSNTDWLPGHAADESEKAFVESLDEAQLFDIAQQAWTSDAPFELSHFESGCSSPTNVDFPFSSGTSVDGVFLSFALYG